MMPQAIWNGIVLAQAKEARIRFVDNRYYFPPSSVDGSLLKTSQTVTFCPQKGRETNYHIAIEGDVFLRNAAIAYYQPFHGYEFLKGFIAFKAEKGIWVSC